MQIQLISVPRDFLEDCLIQAETDWERIDGEFGPTKGGLEGWVVYKPEGVIARLRKILQENPEKIY